MRALLILLVLAGLGVGGWFAYGHWISPPERPTYKEAPVKRGTIVATVSATGTVQPLVKVLVGSQVSGTVMELKKDFNDIVKKDDSLAVLDQDRYQAQLAQRKAAVASKTTGMMMAGKNGPR